MFANGASKFVQTSTQAPTLRVALLQHRVATVHSTLSATKPVSVPHPSKEECKTPIKQESPNSTPTSSQSFRASWPTFHKLDPEAKFQLTQEMPSLSQHEVKKVYNKRRTLAMENELESRFFTNTTRLAGYQALCRAVRIEPSNSIHDCRADLRGTLVNIVDLIEALELNKPVKVWPRKKWHSFVMYTENSEKCFYLEEAKKSELLQCFLQHLSRGASRLSGNPRPLRRGGYSGLPTSASTSLVSEDADSSAAEDSKLKPRKKKHRKRRAQQMDCEVAEQPEAKRVRLASSHQTACSLSDTEGVLEASVQAGHIVTIPGSDSVTDWPAGDVKEDEKAVRPDPAHPETMPESDASHNRLSDDGAAEPNTHPTTIPDSASEGGLTDYLPSDSDTDTDTDVFEAAMQSQPLATQSQQGGSKHAPIIIIDENDGDTAPSTPATVATGRSLFQLRRQGEKRTPKRTLHNLAQKSQESARAADLSSFLAEATAER